MRVFVAMLFAISATDAWYMLVNPPLFTDLFGQTLLNCACLALTAIAYSVATYKIGVEDSSENFILTWVYWTAFCLGFPFAGAILGQYAWNSAWVVLGHIHFNQILFTITIHLLFKRFEKKKEGVRS